METWEGGGQGGRGKVENLQISEHACRVKRQEGKAEREGFGAPGVVQGQGENLHISGHAYQVIRGGREHGGREGRERWG